MAWGTTGAHLSSIGAVGGVGAGSGDDRQRDSGGTAAAARIPAQWGGKLGHVCAGELRWGLGKSLELLVVHGHKRREKLTGGANGGRWQTGYSRARARGFIGQAAHRGGFARASSPQERRLGCGGGW
jgi:hypothetical protein